jgi:uncharacterized membrane protein
MNNMKNIVRAACSGVAITALGFGLYSSWFGNDLIRPLLLVVGITFLLLQLYYEWKTPIFEDVN